MTTYLQKIKKGLRSFITKANFKNEQMSTWKFTKKFLNDLKSIVIVLWKMWVNLDETKITSKNSVADESNELFINFQI